MNIEQRMVYEYCTEKFRLDHSWELKGLIQTAWILNNYSSGFTLEN